MIRTLAAVALAGLAAAPAHAQEPLVAPKALIITMFSFETKPWLDGEALTRRITVPGLSKSYPTVGCSEGGLCVMTTGMGYANAASSVSALVFSGMFDLTKTYVIISGIAGVDPAKGTIGGAFWARFAADVGLQNEIDAREAPEGWSSGYLAIGSPGPGQKGELRYGGEVFRLDEKLLQSAFRLTKDIELSDGDAAKAYRARYGAPPASAPPAVAICDTMSSDTWWHGARLAAAMAERARLETGGAADPCTTQQEDNATLTALSRAAEAKRLDLSRVALLRTASNFDREAPGQSAAESLAARSGGFVPSVVNAYRVAGKLAHAIIADWTEWSVGPPQ
jgi:purine nucleoside permease